MPLNLHVIRGLFSINSFKIQLFDSSFGGFLVSIPRSAHRVNSGNFKIVHYFGVAAKIKWCVVTDNIQDFATIQENSWA